MPVNVGEVERQFSARLGDHIRDINKKTIPTHYRENGYSMDREKNI